VIRADGKATARLRQSSSSNAYFAIRPYPPSAENSVARASGEKRGK
jgi:hypothetical protein